ncbi:heptaprenyl diphosphate synthase component 1 [Oceanobacillus arenosus]|uniref:heptaprenyl diphosphate synthase component 1 n=1 Tax=Oceanobacillus arenosus TaxID=1229153 RepID=UPI0014736EC0|nr:heptaprenyl diphosphate synthase component 1 [Oceanobacillus arenosus]
MNTSNIDTTYFKKLLQDSIHHKYLEKYIKQPTIDEDKLFILSTLINNTAGLSINEKEHYILTTMMVQIALDTHETVPVETSSKESHDEAIANQLTVLAGDYYSGLYYLLLAEIEDFEFIHRLATAIKEINENKMKLYYREVTTLDEYLFLIEQIDTLLILHVANYVKDHSLDNISGEWLLMNRLIQAKSSLVNGNPTPIMKQIANSDRNNATSQIRIDTMIENKKKTIESLLVGLPVEHTAFQLHVQLKLAEVTYAKISIAEEG